MKILKIPVILILFSIFLFYSKVNSMNFERLRKISSPIICEITKEIAHGIIEILPHTGMVYNLRRQSNGIEKILGLIKFTLLFYYYIKNLNCNYNIQINVRLNPTGHNINILTIKYLRKLGNCIGLYLTAYFNDQLYNIDQYILKSVYKILLRFMFNDVFKSGEINVSEICVICREDNTSNNSGITICNHTFHKYCLKNWLITGNFICPTCRANIFTGTQAIIQ